MVSTVYLLSLALSFWNTIVCAPPRCIHPVFAVPASSFREIKFLTSASSTSRNFCIATLSIFLSLKLLLFSPWKMTSKFYYPFFLPIFKSRECTHRARNGWSKDLQLNASYHRKSIKNRQFAPVCLTYLNTVLSDVLDRDESRWEERTLQINLIETEILSRRYALIASGRLVESGR